MTASAMQKILTFVRKADAIPGNDSRKMARLKNASLTSGQPGELMTTRTTTATNTAVETTAIVTARLADRPPFRLPTIFEPRSSVSRGLL